MRVRLDRENRILLAPEILEQTGWAAGTELELDILNGHVELSALRPEAKLEYRDGIPLLVAPIDTPAWTVEQVNEEIRSLREGKRGA